MMRLFLAAVFFLSLLGAALSLTGETRSLVGAAASALGWNVNVLAAVISGAGWRVVAYSRRAAGEAAHTRALTEMLVALHQGPVSLQRAEQRRMDMLRLEERERRNSIALVVLVAIAIVIGIAARMVDPEPPAGAAGAGPAATGRAGVPAPTTKKPSWQSK